MQGFKAILCSLCSIGVKILPGLILGVLLSCASAEEETQSQREALMEGAFLVEEFEDAQLEAPLMIQNGTLADGQFFFDGEGETVLLRFDDPDIDFREVVLRWRIEGREARMMLTAPVPGGEPHLFLHPESVDAQLWENDAEAPVELGGVSGDGGEWSLAGLRMEENGELCFLRNGEVFARTATDSDGFLESVSLGYNGEGRVSVDYILLRGERIQDSPTASDPEGSEDSGGPAAGAAAASAEAE